MRKAANILGTICVVAVFIGALFRIFHFPFGGLTFILFAGLFAGIALPLNLFALLRDTKSAGTKRFAQIAGTLAAMHVIILLLFLAQNWDGYEKFLLQGGVLAVVFIVLLLVSRRSEAERLEVFSKFNVRFAVLVVLLAVSAVLTAGLNDERDRLVALNEMEMAKYDSLRAVVDEQYSLALSDTSLTDSAASIIREYLQNTTDLIARIEQIQYEFVTEGNYGVNYYTIDTSLILERPMDFDMTAHYFVGADVQNPSGKATELYHLLVKYRNDVLHPDVPFFVRKESTSEENVQWVKDNFYHARAIEVMTRLTLVKENIYQSMLYSVDHNLFVQEPE